MLRFLRPFISNLKGGRTYLKTEVFVSANLRFKSSVPDFDDGEDLVFPLPVVEGPSAPITTTLNIIDTAHKLKKWPAFGVLDERGYVRDRAGEPEIDQDFTRRIYRIMGRVQALDSVFYDIQRQGRISFYMQSTGEEASIVGRRSFFFPSEFKTVSL
jgi:hypothetical protein